MGRKSDSVIMEKNYIDIGTFQSTGLSILTSQNWVVGQGTDKRNIIVNIDSPGQYLYVGATTTQYQFPTTFYYDIPTQEKLHDKKYFNHTITQDNLAGTRVSSPDDGFVNAKPIYYFYDANDTAEIILGASTQTKHLQIIGGENWDVSGFTIDSGDPELFQQYH